jgi:hypothetical protein
VNKSFHTSRVRLWHTEEISSQAEINAQERRNIAGRVAERDDDGNIEEKWEFEKILDVHDEAEDGTLTYQIKWKHYDETTWQPEEDMKGSRHAIQRFHEQNPDKPEPPNWVKKHSYLP